MLFRSMNFVTHLKMELFINCAYILAAVIPLISCELIVNARNKGGETIVEKIVANTTADTVTLEFLGSDGSFITQFIDFKSEIQIFRMYILGEEELGQTQPQIICFITQFVRSDFITADAMSKLRQKNPTAIRTPEEEREMNVYTLDLMINLEKAYVISPYVFNICSEAKDGIYGLQSDLRAVSKSLDKDFITLISATSELLPSKHAKCRDTPDSSKPCTCQVHTCIGWYPCGLKYCRGTDSNGKEVNYRCGIKTCKRCLAFVYVANPKLKCLWDF